MKVKAVLAVFFCSVLFSHTVLADTIHVPADQPTIQSAINVAVNDNLVLVAPGTYVENLDFLGKIIEVRSETGADRTIIDGDQAGPVVTFGSAEPNGAVLEGFSIETVMPTKGGGSSAIRTPRRRSRTA